MALRNVIYYNSGNPKIPLGTGISQLPYTDVIVANLQPTAPGNLTLIGWGNAFDDQLQNNIRLLLRAGKNVLISFGGALNHKSGLTTAAYKAYAANVPELVNQIVTVVKGNLFSGVDIDYEDSAGFGNNAAYDGVEFLTALTIGLFNQLPPSHNIITHAPAVPYWDSHSIYARGGIAPYYQVWLNARSYISWFNNQFYDNAAWDATADLKVEKYQAIAGLTGPQTQVLGALVGPGDPDGYITLGQLQNNVIARLKSQYGSEFGGVMGWEFAQDGPPTYGTPGAWANGISQAVGR
jgi:chitinase